MIAYDVTQLTLPFVNFIIQVYSHQTHVKQKILAFQTSKLSIFRATVKR